MTPQSPKARKAEEKAKQIFLTCGFQPYDDDIAYLAEQIKLAQEEARAESITKVDLETVRLATDKAYAKGFSDGEKAGLEKQWNLIKQSPTTKLIYDMAYKDGQVAMRERAENAAMNACLHCEHTSLIEVCRTVMAIRALEPKASLRDAGTTEGV